LKRDFLPKPALLLSPGAFLTGTMRQPSSGVWRLVAQAIRENSLVEQWDIPHCMPNEHNRAASALCTSGA
jgi:hypothetical protein